MAATIAIIGRPNVGKSTLFNKLTQTRNALVANQPGVTRDRQYGITEHRNRPFILIDTGGLYDIHDTSLSISQFVSEQAFIAVQEADAVLWLVDGRAGLSSVEEELAQELRRYDNRLYLLVNKSEGLDEHLVCAEFHALGIGVRQPHVISAKRGTGISSIMDVLSSDISVEDNSNIEQPKGLKISLIGRPNVGKSTLINRIVGKKRVLTFGQPGTTRDSIAVPFRRRDKDYILVDTAGVRRRSKVTNDIEKFSIVKTLEAIITAQIIILIIDAQEAVTDQDLSLLGLSAESGKSLIVAVNKWDNLEQEQKVRIKNQIDRKLDFVSYACVHYISALHGTGADKLFTTIDKIDKTQSIEVKSSRTTEILHAAIEAYQPPLVRGRRIKLRYAHLGGHNPLRIVIHGNQTDKVSPSYQRYLSNTFRKQLKLIGTPVLIDFKKSNNPFKDNKNVLTKHQQAKRKRLMKYVKKKGVRS